MARIYISGPMTGIENYKEIFVKAEQELQEQGHSVVNPALVDFILTDATYEEYMKVDMFLLNMCDTIYMLKGWEKSCGANREYGYAIARNYTVLHEE